LCPPNKKSPFQHHIFQQVQVKRKQELIWVLLKRLNTKYWLVSLKKETYIIRTDIVSTKKVVKRERYSVASETPQRNIAGE
jgi:hypothetical protein